MAKKYIFRAQRRHPTDKPYVKGPPGNLTFSAKPERYDAAYAFRVYDQIGMGTEAGGDRKWMMEIVDD